MSSAGTGNLDHPPPESMRSDDRPGVPADSDMTGLTATAGAGRKEVR